jgi:hypothetical protein
LCADLHSKYEALLKVAQRALLSEYSPFDPAFPARTSPHTGHQTGFDPSFALDLELEILALRHQIGVLERSVHKGPRLTSTDDLLWVSLYRFWRHWRSTLLIVKPETVVA